MVNHPNRRQFTIRLSREELDALRALVTEALRGAVGRGAQLLSGSTTSSQNPSNPGTLAGSRASGFWGGVTYGA